MIGNMISNMMVKPGQSPLFDSPDAHGLDYENVEFQAEDGVTLRGWLIRGGSDRVIVQTHFGVQCNRGGWTPKGHGPITPWKKDIQFLRQARYLVGRGYSVLMYDMRGHGESDLGPIHGSAGGRKRPRMSSPRSTLSVSGFPTRPSVF